MSEGFSANHEHIAKHARGFDDHAGRAESVVKELRDALDENKAPWGSDAVGQAFAASHDQHAAEVLDQIGAIHGALGDLGRKFAAAAKTYESTDDDVRTSLTSTDHGSGG